jgi:drug/metabolite transporter (DMT)-like permease
MINRRFRPTGLSPRRIALGLMLGGFGYVGYFICAAYAVKSAGPALPPMIIGTMPLITALIANRGENATQWQRLFLPMTLILTGLVVVNIGAFPLSPTRERQLLPAGIIAAMMALAIWVAYGVLNARVMRAADAPDSLRWTGLQGIGAAIGSLCLLPLASFDAGSEGMKTFLLWALVMGLAGSWAATWFWGIASRRLPLTLSAQLIVAETVFGLFYGFLYESRWPTAAEWSGCALQIIGVGLGIRAFVPRVLSRKQTSSFDARVQSR